MGTLRDIPERILALRQTLSLTARTRVHAPTPVAQIETIDAPVRMRIYRPGSAQPLPVLLLIHGGGWVAGSIDTHDEIARVLAAWTPAIVASLDYTLAPERHWPHQLAQAAEALRWLQNDAQRIAIVGDSAGGQIAACLALHQRGAFAAQVLINPALDLVAYDTEPTSFYRDQYLADLGAAHEASPARVSDLAGLPPTLVIAAGQDVLHRENLAYATRLLAQGVVTDWFCLDEHKHFGMNWAVADDSVQPAIDRTVAFLRTHLHSGA
jgi:acetyl esterase